MSDCQNVEIRELLPDLLHGRLSAPARQRVEAHLAECQDCADELSLLRSVRAAFERVPAMDTAAIVRALPLPNRRVAGGIWGHRTALRIAAAVSFISLGGISLAVARSFFGPKPTIMQVDTAMRASLPGDTNESTVLVNTSTTTPVISFAGGVSDLGAEDIEALITDIESIEAAPLPEPVDVTQGEAAARSGGSED
jgi:Putative zinc-finger